MASAADHGAAKSWTKLSNWTKTIKHDLSAWATHPYTRLMLIFWPSWEIVPTPLLKWFLRFQWSCLHGLLDYFSTYHSDVLYPRQHRLMVKAWALGDLRRIKESSRGRRTLKIFYSWWEGHNGSKSCPRWHRWSTAASGPDLGSLWHSSVLQGRDSRDLKLTLHWGEYYRSHLLQQLYIIRL